MGWREAKVIQGILFFEKSGKAGIRTLDTLASITVFETAPFDRSGTFPLKQRCKGKQNCVYFR